MLYSLVNKIINSGLLLFFPKNMYTGMWQHISSIQISQIHCYSAHHVSVYLSGNIKGYTEDDENWSSQLERNCLENSALRYYLGISLLLSDYLRISMGLAPFLTNEIAK